MGPEGPAGSDADVTAHENAANPHPVYLTEAEGDAKYALAGAGGGATPNPAGLFEYFNDFLVLPPKVATETGHEMLGAAFNAPDPTLLPSEAGRPGIARMSSTGAGRNYLHLPVATAFRVPMVASDPLVFEASLRIAFDTSNQYQILAGFWNYLNGWQQNDGAYFLYDIGGNAGGAASGNFWQTVLARAGARTYATTAVAVTTAWTRLRVEVDYTEARFYVNGALAGTMATPKLNGLVFGAGAMMIKTSGTAEHGIDVDYIHVSQKLNR